MKTQDRSYLRLAEVLVISFTLLLITRYLMPLWSQSADKPANDENKSWTKSTQSDNTGVNPTRTVQSHSQSGNRTIDKKSIERRNSDGHFEHYLDVETETVQLDRNTVRTITRSLSHNENGEKKLVQVTEEQQNTLPGGNSKVERVTSNSDINGNLSVVQREVEETRKTGENTEETQKTVMLPGVNGMAPATRTQERRTKTGKDTMD